MINNIKKIAYLLIIGLSFLAFWGCKKIAAGSYPYAQYYHFELPKDELLSRIHDFKKQYPQYSVSDSIYKEYRREHWHWVYFYNPLKNYIYHCRARSESGTSGSSFAWIAYSKNGESRGEYTDVNDGLDKEIQKEAQKYLETEILPKLGECKREKTFLF